MEELKGILEKIDDFHCNIFSEEITFPGVLKNEDDEIFLQGKVGIDQCRKINHYKPFQAWATIDGTPVTLLNVYCVSSSHTWGENYETVTFSPSEIVICRATSTEIRITRILTCIPSINNMFSTSPLRLKIPSRERPSVLDDTYPQEILTDDKYGHLRIYQSYGHRWNQNEITFQIKPIIEYQFYQPIEAMSAVKQIAAARNLLAFFANYYLPIKSFSFADEQSRKIDGITFEDCTLILNHKDEIPVLQDHFLITTSEFTETFSDIWGKWLDLYEQAKYIPTLFYEIICDRSTGINRFLNLTQAIEIYSRKYREKEAEEITNMQIPYKRRKQFPAYLRYRFEDIFSLLKECSGISEDKIRPLSKALADMRNFFTHYGKKQVEPSHQELLAASHVLEFIILAIIYHAIGIPDCHIESCRKRAQFQRYDEFVVILLSYFARNNGKASGIPDN